jgi:hypothetical protein
MKKKLLLSFAVFATAISVSAQKRVASTRIHKEYKVDYSTNVDNDNSTDFSIRSLSSNVQKKRAVQNLTDTSQFFGYKTSYASPKTSGSYVAPMIFKDSVDLATVFQIIPNNTPIILKGIMTSIVSVNPKGSDVQVKIYDMTTGATLAKAQKTITYSASQMSMVGFVFDKPYSTSSDILISIEPANVKDSFYVSNSGAYKNSSVTCNITGNQLTLVSPAPTSPANVGAGFWTGQEITGAGIPAGTKITAYNSTSKAYTISSTVSSPITSVIVSGVNLAFTALANNSGFMYLKFPATNGVIDFTKAPKEAADALIWEKGTDGKWSPKDANLTIYPIVQYDFESSPIIDNNCLGNNKSVNLTYSNTNAFSIAKNPLLNKMAFWTQYLGYNKKSGYFHSRAYTSSKSYLDTLDNSASAFKYLYTAKSDASNDTLRVLDILLPYGFYKNPGTKGFLNTFLLSSKIEATNIVTDAKCVGEKVKVEVKATGGFGVLTGIGVFNEDAVSTSKIYDVLDANKCKVSTSAQIKAVTGTGIAPVVTAVVVDAKCFGDSAKVTVTATGTGTLTGIGVKTFAAVVASKTLEVKNEAGCVGMAVAQIKAAPTKVVATATVVDAKCFGDSAKVTIAATGGTGNSFTGTGVKLIANPKASTVKYAVVDANACKSDSVSATIKAAPVKIEATATVTDAKCFGDSALVEVKATGGTPTFTGVGIKKFTATAGTQKIEVLDANKCKATVDAAIKAAPAKLEGTTSSVAAHGTAKDGKASIVVKGGIAPYKYTWTGSTDTTATIIVVKGTYTPSVIDANKCKLTAAAITVALSSVESLSISGLSIYPNPVANELNVKFNAISAATIELVNVAGQVIASKDASEFANVTFDTATLNAGVYFVNIKVAEGVFTQKIIKE